MMGIERLIGETLTEIKGLEKGSESVSFYTEKGDIYGMYHSQDCCESVEIEDVIGDVDDLIGSIILNAEEVTNSDEHPEGLGRSADYFTWTFYNITTIKGTVTIRWYGESNGYYSEDVDFRLLSKN